MGYVERNLTNGEEIIYRANISWGVFFRPIILIIFMIWLSSKIHKYLVCIIVVISLILLFRILLEILTREFALTSRRIMAKKGIIMTHTMEILLSKVESITVTQPLDGRIFNFGTVTIVGSGGSREIFHSIASPYELQKQVNQQLSTDN